MTGGAWLEALHFLRPQWLWGLLALPLLAWAWQRRHAARNPWRGTIDAHLLPHLLEDAPRATTVLVPLSGGGLLAGVALALRTLNPAIRIIGVTMERGAAMRASLDAGRPVAVEELPTLADSLGGGIGLINRHTFGMVRDLVNEVVLVSEADIAAAMRAAYFEEGEVLEGAAAVGIAALDTGRVTLTGPVVVLLSGKNIDMDLHRRIVSGETPDLAAERDHG